MSLYDWLLFIHVLSAFALVAGEVLFSALTFALRNRDVPGEVAALFRTARAGEILVGAGSIGTLVFGIWLAIYVDGYEIWDGWILASLVLWAITAELRRREGKEYGRADALATDLRSRGVTESPELRAALRSQTGLVYHVLGSVAVLAILWLMIFKPGA